MSSGALLIARLSDPESLIPAAQALEKSEFVDCWNAVDGHVQLVAKLHTSATQLPEPIRNLRGIEEMHVFDLTEETGSLVCDPSLCYSFLFLEAEREKLPAVREQLKTFESIVFCSLLEGKNELVAVLQGLNFQVIDRAIEERVRPLDGILRVKQDRVINLTHM